MNLDFDKSPTDLEILGTKLTESVMVAFDRLRDAPRENLEAEVTRLIYEKLVFVYEDAWQEGHENG